MSQLVAMPDLSLEALRAMMAADHPQPELRDAFINALHVHPRVSRLMPDLQVCDHMTRLHGAP